MQRELLENLSDAGILAVDERHRLRDALKAVLAMQANLSSDTPRIFSSAHAVLANADIHPREAPILVLQDMHKALNLEAAKHEKLIEEINR